MASGTPITNRVWDSSSSKTDALIAVVLRWQLMLPLVLLRNGWKNLLQYVQCDLTTSYVGLLLGTCLASHVLCAPRAASYHHQHQQHQYRHRSRTHNGPRRPDDADKRVDHVSRLFASILSLFFGFWIWAIPDRGQEQHHLGIKNIFVVFFSGLLGYGWMLGKAPYEWGPMIHHTRPTLFATCVDMMMLVGSLLYGAKTMALGVAITLYIVMLQARFLGEDTNGILFWFTHRHRIYARIGPPPVGSETLPLSWNPTDSDSDYAGSGDSLHDSDGVSDGASDGASDSETDTNSISVTDTESDTDSAAGTNPSEPQHHTSRWRRLAWACLWLGSYALYAHWCELRLRPTHFVSKTI